MTDKDGLIKPLGTLEECRARCVRNINRVWKELGYDVAVAEQYLPRRVGHRGKQVPPGREIVSTLVNGMPKRLH
jgi:hypothetical protein